MRGRWCWIGWGIVVLGLTGLPVWGADPEAVRRMMEQYEREAEAEKTPPAPRPRPAAPAPRPRPPAPSVQPEPRWINSELANVRGGPGAGHRTITQLPRGSEVTWLGASTENPAWQRIRLSDGRVAYVHGNLLSRRRIAAAPTPAPTPAPRPTAPTARQSFEPEMVRISGGSFLMGEPESEAGRDIDEFQHWVTVQDFALGKYEVTVGEFKRFVETTGYRTDAERNLDFAGCMIFNGSDLEIRAGLNWRTPGFTQSDTHPVVCVSWNDAVAYAEWLSRQTGQNYRLPTEAEWEYAARAGTKTARYWGEDPDQACRYENVADRTALQILMALQTLEDWTIHDCTDGFSYTAPVGRFAANPWGLHDMLGNASEWTCSLYTLATAEKMRCIEKDASDQRSWRGGSWFFPSEGVRSAYRNGGAPMARGDSMGFRLARSL